MSSLPSTLALEPDQALSHRTLELAVPSSVRRFELRLRRSFRGIELDCLCLPAPEGLEIEVCAGEERLLRRVPPNGRVTLGGLPRGCKHANVFVRGGGLPSLAFFKLPVS